MRENKVLRIVSALLLTLFLSYQAGISFFTHTHTINGVVIVHSHPYTGDSHIHSDAQIYALSQISTFYGEEAIDHSHIGATYLITEKIGVETTAPSLISAHLCCSQFRAPPFGC
ncbi:MAG: hypothetical protein IKA19_03050 [Muribaculaceae bacterium]|nr:hypothetical protein [Muribaculaceae bacterium]